MCARASKPWTLLERYALIRSSKKHLPDLAEKMHRPIEEVQVKYNELLKILAKIWEVELQKLLRQGLEKEEAVGLLLKEKNWKNILFRSVRELLP